MGDLRAHISERRVLEKMRSIKRVVIDVETVNAAFGEGDVDEVIGKLALIFSGQILRKIREQTSRPPALCNAPEAADKILDYNGNTVGSVTVYLEGDEG